MTRSLLAVRNDCLADLASSPSPNHNSAHPAPFVFTLRNFAPLRENGLHLFSNPR